MIRDWVINNKGLVGIVFVATALLVGLWAVVKHNSIVNEGNKQQATLNAQYVDNQNILSDCVVKIRESANVTKAQAATFERVMVETIKGRYLEGSTAQPGSGALFSAIVEQYPDLKGLNDSFARVYDTIIDCRDSYKGTQSKLLDMLGSFERWYEGSFTVRALGGKYPSNKLVARFDGQRLTGQAAFEKMYDIVLVKDADEAYKTGELEALDPLGANQ